MPPPMISGGLDQMVVNIAVIGEFRWKLLHRPSVADEGRDKEKGYVVDKFSKRSKNEFTH